MNINTKNSIMENILEKLMEIAICILVLVGIGFVLGLIFFVLIPAIFTIIAVAISIVVVGVSIAIIFKAFTRRR